MNLWQFETACRCLLVLDMEELVAAGAIADRDYEAWDAFHADPLRWFITPPTKGRCGVEGHLAPQAVQPAGGAATSSGQHRRLSGLADHQGACAGACNGPTARP